jgi:MerR family copper efflux transcriptional regulator
VRDDPGNADDRTGRSAAGYRLYTPDDAEVLAFIRRARTLGLHVDDIAQVLALHRGGTRPCRTVRDLLDSRIAEIDTAIADLTALRAALVESRAAATRRTPAHPDTVCPIIDPPDADADTLLT